MERGDNYINPMVKSILTLISLQDCKIKIVEVDQKEVVNVKEW